MQNRKTYYTKDTNIDIFFKQEQGVGEKRRLEGEKSEDKNEINKIITGLTFEQNPSDSN